MPALKSVSNLPIFNNDFQALVQYKNISLLINFLNDSS
jgi:hypothetical protein